jgi:hypothetical protein
VPDRNLDRIVEQLMEKPVPREERIRLLKLLVREGRDLPDSFLEEALSRLLERLADG